MCLQRDRHLLPHTGHPLCIITALTLGGYRGVRHNNYTIVLLYLKIMILPVSLYCPFLIVPSVLSNVYLLDGNNVKKKIIIYKTKLK
jgi:hypothetical protein